MKEHILLMESNNNARSEVVVPIRTVVTLDGKPLLKMSNYVELSH